jgi:hypothetical protein
VVQSRSPTRSRPSKSGTPTAFARGERWLRLSRLQLQGELQSKIEAPRLYKGVIHGVAVIAQKEGPRGLFRGIGAAVCFSNPTVAASQRR